MLCYDISIFLCHGVRPWGTPCVPNSVISGTGWTVKFQCYQGMSSFRSICIPFNRYIQTKIHKVMWISVIFLSFSIYNSPNVICVFCFIFTSCLATAVPGWERLKLFFRQRSMPNKMWSCDLEVLLFSLYYILCQVYPSSSWLSDINYLLYI